MHILLYLNYQYVVTRDDQEILRLFEYVHKGNDILQGIRSSWNRIGRYGLLYK